MSFEDMIATEERIYADFDHTMKNIDSYAESHITQEEMDYFFGASSQRSSRTYANKYAMAY